MSERQRHGDGIHYHHEAMAARRDGDVGDQDPLCPNGDLDCALGKVPCFDCLIGGDADE